ncbi:MAG: 3-isopropylmalate dehydrogenase [Pseudomonadota bacterium]
MAAKIVTLPGDGIGPEVCAAAHSVLTAVAEQFGHQFDIQECLVGGAAIDATGVPLPPDSLRQAQAADGILLGAVGGPQWADPDIMKRPEAGLLQLRSALGLYANLRPVVTQPATYDASPIKAERLAGVDIMVVRELTGGIYFGDKQEGDTEASDLCVYTREEVTRVVRMAAQLARERRGKVTSVDKANVLATSRLWRSVTTDIMTNEFPDVALEHLLVDAAAMHLLSRPASFDVIVTENMFGDILTDEASMIVGSMGLLPSASLGDRQTETGTPGLYEPIHGSAPDIAGKGIANPCGMIASSAMMLRHSLSLPREAAAVELAIKMALSDGVGTPDLAPADTPLNTRQMTQRVVDRLTGG